MKPGIFVFLFIVFAACSPAGPAGAQEVHEILTWENCVQEAAKNHPDLIVAVENVSQSVSQKQITASTLYPQVTSDVSAGTAKSAASGTKDTYSYGVSGSQLIFDGFKTVSDVKAAGQNIQAAKENYRFVSSDVRQRLRTAFISLLRAQALIEVTEDIARIRKNNLVLITLRYQSGLEHKGALLTAEANLAQAKFEVEQAKRDLIVAQWQLTKELGRTDFMAVAVQGEFGVDVSGDQNPDFKALAAIHPSLQVTVAQKNAAVYGVKAAKENFFPVVTGDADIGKTSSHWPPQSNTWSVGLGLSLPLFEGGLKTAQLDQAKSVLTEAQANERSTYDGVILALEQSWASLKDAAETVAVKQKFLVATEERSRIAQAQYSIGMMSYDNWTIIEDDLVQAKKDLLDAQANALQAEANWVLAKGETLEYEE
ncbi:MAG: TolC family protein [Candidatus Omnitrophica bacterium]|nr:TolC family protein [Candidatus Omnitrophota bacterium]MDD5573610.1 TolC family protein [Candidatus Omnitrophota bacterium]